MPSSTAKLTHSPRHYRCLSNWSSLPSDLLRRIGDHYLAAGDIDSYMDMRCVCNGWRSAVPKPPPLDAGAEYSRFRPRHWVMLDEKQSMVAADGRRLFVNVSTGRFLRRRVPMLHDHHLLAASDGLLVLRGKSSVHAARVLDPFTGSTLVCSPDLDEDDDMMTVYFVTEPGSELRMLQFPHFSEDRLVHYVHSMVAHAGHVYVVDSEGCLFRILDSEEERPSFGYGELITRMAIGNDMYLAESAGAGELLLINLQRDGAAQVYRVDAERKVLEHVHSFGRHAIFLGFTNCLCIDADKFPSTDPNCLYSARTWSGIDGLTIWSAAYRHDLSNSGRKEDVCDDMDVSSGTRQIGPPSLAKVLLDYSHLLAD